ncbi:MAG: hypothetical protein ABIT71_12145, partial [Vicinamibacteraceae bacterium]
MQVPAGPARGPRTPRSCRRGLIAALSRRLSSARWLGTDPTTGERHLPDAVRSSLVNNGKGLYQLHDV